MEANMQILEGAQYRLRVKLTNEAGAQLPPELFRVYAGAFCPGYAPAHFHAERTAEEWMLTMPGLKPGRVPWNWQLLAAEYATGVEWLLAAGEVTVMPRHATGSGFVDPGELKIVATLDKTTLQMTVQVGESTSACSLAVVDARNSAKAAANSAAHAAEQAQAAGKAAQTAGEKATEAGEHATAAGKAAQTAGEKATEAGEHATAADKAAQTAGEKATEAGEHATAADKAAQTAGEKATEAGEHATAAGKAAQTAGEKATEAGEHASAAGKAAQTAGEKATEAGEHASAAGKAAQTAGEKATEAGEHATAAGKAAQTAGEKADEAVLAAAAAKAAEAGSAAAADVVRYDFLPMTLEWLDSRFTKTLGEGKFSMTYTEEENTLRVAFALETTAAQIAEVESLLERVLPRKLVTEIDEMPLGFTWLEYLKGDGKQFIKTALEVTAETGVRADYMQELIDSSSIEPVGTRKSSENLYYTFLPRWRRDMMNGMSVLYSGSSFNFNSTPYVRVSAELNFKNSGLFRGADAAGNKQETDLPKFSAGIMPPYTLWGSGARMNGIIWSCEISQGEEIISSLRPALDPTGTPCMFDTVTRKPFRNDGSGQFIAGVETQKQLDNVLRGLPDRTGQTGAELHLRLSDELYESAVASGIIEETATARNWQIAYDSTTTA